MFFCLKLKVASTTPTWNLPSSSHVCVCLCGFLLRFYDWPGGVRRKLSLRSNSHPVIRLLSCSSSLRSVSTTTTKHSAFPCQGRKAPSTSLVTFFSYFYNLENAQVSFGRVEASIKRLVVSGSLLRLSEQPYVDLRFEFSSPG